jgi:hypothetical protein
MMIDLKRILKKHFKYTKDNRNILTPFNYKKFNHLYSLTNMKRDLTGEEIFLILSLQGEERTVGFENENVLFFKFPRDYSLHYESSLSESIFLSDLKNKIIVKISRYGLFSPEIIEKENLLLTKYQGYSFQFINHDLIYNSGIFFPFYDNSKVQYTSNGVNNFNFSLNDQNNNSIILKKTDNYYNLNFEIYKKKYFVVFAHDTNKVLNNPGLFNKFHNLSNKSYNFISNVVDSNFIISNKIFYHHGWEFYNTVMLEKIINNFSSSINEPIKFKKTNTYTYSDVIKENKRDITVESYLSDKNITSDLLINVNLIYGSYSVVFTEKGFIEFKGFEKENVEKKLKRLFHPLERPSVDTFLLHKLNIRSIIPSIIYLICLICLIITFIISFIFFTKHLFSRRSKTPLSSIGNIQ